MKIALIGNSLAADFRGGTEVVVQAQARELLALGHDVRILSAGVAGEPARETERDGVRCIRVHRTPDEAGSPEWCREPITARVQAACAGCDLVHVHHWSELSGDLVRHLAVDSPVVLSLHDHFASCARYFRQPIDGELCPVDEPTRACAACVAPMLGSGGRPELSGLQRIEGRLRQRWNDFRAEILAASAIVCPSESLRASLSREMRLDGSAWIVSPHGLCRPLARVRNRRRPGEALTVLSFGNRTSVKGLLDLVRGMAALPKHRARLIVAGAELEAGFDDRLRAAAGDLSIEFHGAYDEDSLSALATRADLAVFPSRAQESYGLVVEEALALGLPTWISDRGALPEVLGRYARAGELPGGLVPAESPTAWTKLLRELVESGARLHDARERVPVQLRSAADAARQLSALYHDLRRCSTVSGT